MCAMAATHARIRRMTYCIADKHQGALGGAFKLHGQRSLNHHYQVFQLPADGNVLSTAAELADVQCMNAST